jgi:chromosome segregation ATPase
MSDPNYQVMRGNCNFCGEPMDSGNHPLTESGARSVIDCQVKFLLRRADDLQSRLHDVESSLALAKAQADHDAELIADFLADEATLEASLAASIKESAAQCDRADRMVREWAASTERVNALSSRLDRGLERIERLRDWIQNWADESCEYGEMDFEACGHNRKHGICEPCSARRVLAQDVFVSDAPAVENQRKISDAAHE